MSDAPEQIWTWTSQINKPSERYIHIDKAAPEELVDRAEYWVKRATEIGNSQLVIFCMDLREHLQSIRKTHSEFSETEK